MATAANQTIATALNKIGLICAKLAIQKPVGLKMARVYERPLPIKHSIDETPATILTWTMPNYRLGISVGFEAYVVNMRILHVGVDEDLNAAAAIMNSFHEQVLTTFSEYLNLSQSVASFEIRMGAEGMGVVDYNNKAFIALDYFLDVQLLNDRAFAALTL